jgi:hypothetical protein
VLPRGSSGSGSTASSPRAVAPTHCHAAGTCSTRIHRRCRRPPPTRRRRVCSCRRVLNAVGSWSPSNDSRSASSPCTSSSRHSRLTLRDRGARSTHVNPSSRRPIRRRVRALPRRRHHSPDHRVLSVGIASRNSLVASGHGTPHHLNASAPAFPHSTPITIRRVRRKRQQLRSNGSIGAESLPIESYRLSLLWPAATIIGAPDGALIAPN